MARGQKEHGMRVFAQAIDLVDDPAMIAEYEEHHRRVWPEVVGALRAIGITGMRIFRTGPRLFMFYEAPDGFDPATDYQAYTADPRCRAWDQLMRRYQRPVPGAPPGAWWTPMVEVFSLD
ncbi:MAG: L-rhamnose mutarotase [Phycisphaerales bacterium]|nr:L-rhamnose mutarotase [Phycisphaerales bacterium]